MFDRTLHAVRRQRGAIDVRDVMRRFIRAPLSRAVTVLSIAATLLWWTKPELATDLHLVASNHDIWDGRVWSLAASALVHGDILHLAFNLYWVWVMWTELERRTTVVRALAFGLGAALFSGAAQLIVSDDAGIGLSGVGYAAFGYCWSRSPRDTRIAALVPPDTVRLWLGWGLLCIGLTYVGMWNIGNTAHGAGLAFGWLVARAAFPGPTRLPAAAALVVAAAACVAAWFVGPPWSRSWHTARAYTAMQADRPNDALPLIRRAEVLAADSAWCLRSEWWCLDAIGDTKGAAEIRARIVTQEPSLAAELGLSQKPTLAERER